MQPNESITPRHILAIRRLNLRLEDFVKEGFRDEINFGKINGDLTFGLVAQRALDDLENLARFQTQSAKKKSQDDSDFDQELIELAYERYVTFVSRHSVSGVAQQPPVEVELLKKDRIASVLEAKGLKYPDLGLLDATNDPVVRAWNTARLNRRRGLQRVGAFFFLSSQVPSGLYGDQSERVEAEGRTAVQYLFNRAADFYASELKFAVLLGGGALARTKADLVKDSFGSDMAIIQYLQVDEKHPYSYSAKTAEDLRSKIKEYAGVKP